MMTIAWAALQEAVRKKMAGALGAITLIYLGLYYAMVYHYANYLQQHPGAGIVNVTMIVTQIIGIVGLYFSNMLVAFLTIVVSFGAISTEVENGTIHAILSKPLLRRDYLFGKYLGLAGVTLVYTVFLYLGVLGIARFCHLPVASSLSIASIVKGLLFFCLQPLAILALVIYGSSVFKTLTNGIVVIALYLLSLVGGMMEQIGALVNRSVYLWGIFSSLVAPFDVIYRLMAHQVFADLGVGNFLMPGTTGGSTTPSPWMVLYIGLYIFGLLWVACRKFERRDLA